MEITDNSKARESMIGQEQAAAIVYQDLKESERATFGVAAEYGRWLIASLILINGGALWGLFTYIGDTETKLDALGGFIAPIWSFIIGIAMGMITGFGAWLNWSMHSNNYRAMAPYDMLWNPNKWVAPPTHKTGIFLTYWITILCGFASLFAAVAGGAFLMHGNFVARLVFWWFLA